MAESTLPKKANYCYRCGKRIGRGQEVCYYCTAPVERVIREARRCPFCHESIQRGATKCRHCGEFLPSEEEQNRCPFCAEKIQPGAKKCPHCGEFLDEDAKAAAVREQKQTNLIFMIPKELAGGDQPLFIPAGERVAGLLADRLSQGTQEAIESGQPRQIDMPNVRALPPSEAKALLAAPDSGEIPSYTSADVPAVIDAESKALVRPSPARLAKLAKVPARFIKNLAVAIIKKPRPPKKVSVSATEHKLKSPFKNCPKCDAEVLTEDNFCYHCGQVMHSKSELKTKAPGQKTSNLAVYTAIVAMIAVHQVMYYSGFSNMIDILLVLAFLTSFISLLRKPGLVSVFWTLLTLVLGVFFLSGGFEFASRLMS